MDASRGLDQEHPLAFCQAIHEKKTDRRLPTEPGGIGTGKSIPH